ncbi:response regulator [Thalassotalea fusca]
MHYKPIEILMADDDKDDQILTKKALQRSKLLNNLNFVNDGVFLMDYLNRRGEYADTERFPFPDIILLDLNMPRMGGREALELIKSDAKLKAIPVVVLTTSKEDEEIIRSYKLGANSYITKPVDFNGFMNAMKILSEYWVSIVRLPPKM